jgi:glycosyltransferase involved in cell wall biosynthesis
VQGGVTAPPLVVMLSAAHPPLDVRVVAKEGAALAAAGWRVRHVAPAPADGSAVPVMAHGVEIECWPRRGRGWLARLLALPSLVRRAVASGAAVLHASEPDAWLAAFLAARRCGARVVIDVHEHYPSRLDPRLPAPLRPPVRALLRWLCRAAGWRADAVVVAKDGLDHDFGVPARTVAVRNYAAPTPIAPRRHEAGPLRLAHLGALTRERGALEMLHALALCPPKTRLRLIGRFTDGSETAFWELARQLTLTDRVENLGWLPQPAALAALAECDIGLVLFQPGVENHRLALPHKLFDCMLAGLPVIAPRFAEEVAAIVTAAACGRLVDTASPAVVAEAAVELAAPALRQQLGSNGRKAALTIFGWEGEARRLVGLYGRLGRERALPSRALPAGD